MTNIFGELEKLKRKRVAMNRGPKVTKRPFPMKMFREARSKIKEHLNRNFDEKEWSSTFGPPSLMFSMDLGIRPRNQSELFLEEMVKAGVLAIHPQGGYMDPRWNNVMKEKHK